MPTGLVNTDEFSELLVQAVRDEKSEIAEEETLGSSAAGHGDRKDRSRE